MVCIKLFQRFKGKIFQPRMMDIVDMGTCIWIDVDLNKMAISFFAENGVFKCHMDNWMSNFAKYRMSQVKGCVLQLHVDYFNQ